MANTNRTVDTDKHIINITLVEVQLLLQRVLDKQSTGKGDTAMILAGCHGHDAVAQVLRSAGARADIATRNGWRYEDWAKWYLRKAKHEDSPDK